jgi:hypothetical protein
MNIPSRIEAFFTLGKDYLNPEKEAFLEVVSKANNQNAWFLPSFILQASSQISQQFLTKEALNDWTSLYPTLSNENTGIKVGIVMAGNIPMVGFHDLLSTLMAGHCAVVKLSSKDTVLMQYIIDSLITIHPDFKNLIIVQEQLKNCDAYIATGGNNAGQYFEQYFGKYPHIIRKNKTSIAVLDGKETSQELSLLADDILLYFGLGCRNVTQLYVPEGYDFIPLLDALKKYSYLLDEHKYKHNYDYQLALLMMSRQMYMDAGGVLLSENPVPFTAISHVHYQYYSPLSMPKWDEQNIQAVVGHQYLPFGSLQKPTLSQYADGVDSLAFLSSL